jgi:hypothetical protein
MAIETQPGRMMLSRDEAISVHTAALDVICAMFDNLTPNQILTMLSSSSRRSDSPVIATYTSVVDRIVHAGHADIIDEQTEGYFSALSVDVGFRELISIKQKGFVPNQQV